MADRVFDADDLIVLKQWDTPTICNGLELIVPERRALGFTVEPMLAVDRRFPPMVGLARVGTIRASAKPVDTPADRMDWYDYVAPGDASGGLPTIAVIQDIDERPGYGAFWGEVQSTVHKALGVLGCVTNGSMRDMDMLAPGFQIVSGRMGPSHAHVHMVRFGEPVDVFGMQTAHDDVIHADYHGAVVIPAAAVRQLPAAIDLVSRREKVILDLCASPAFSKIALRDALKRAGEIH